MAIRVVCEECGAKLKTTQEYAGKELPCPNCGDVVLIPWVVPNDSEFNPYVPPGSNPRDDFDALINAPHPELKKLTAALREEARKEQIGNVVGCAFWMLSVGVWAWMLVWAIRLAKPHEGFTWFVVFVGALVIGSVAIQLALYGLLMLAALVWLPVEAMLKRR